MMKWWLTTATIVELDLMQNIKFDRINWNAKCDSIVNNYVFKEIMDS